MQGHLLSQPGEIKTWTGRLVRPLEMNPGNISIIDIAVGLARAARFRGMTKQYYSVAEHSILVARRCRRPLQLAGLLHDAAEAYLGDVPSPLKQHESFAAYRQAERDIMRCVWLAFDVDLLGDDEIHTADRQQLELEMRHLQVDASPIQDASYLQRVQGGPDGIQCFAEMNATTFFLLTFVGIMNQSIIGPSVADQCHEAGMFLIRYARIDPAKVVLPPGWFEFGEVLHAKEN